MCVVWVSRTAQGGESTLMGCVGFRIIAAIFFCVGPRSLFRPRRGPRLLAKSILAQEELDTELLLKVASDIGIASVPLKCILKLVEDGPFGLIDLAASLGLACCSLHERVAALMIKKWKRSSYTWVEIYQETTRNGDLEVDAGCNTPDFLAPELLFYAKDKLSDARDKSTISPGIVPVYSSALEPSIQNHSVEMGFNFVEG
ncbi:hypothetical protein K469DRAFT_681689 [Zopfia rhizophila CBS 207.26]|uniref:Uncharacterized protein n=1 Tax=Zopfia rhizophila CBS 207.26 TaxID=1314779 RepID=A0A6A6ET90_9PEZI|nr:hypothetical protein K469DRAFT_681689 [Zopfia rhizophila CBS 207.26]